MRWLNFKCFNSTVNLVGGSAVGSSTPAAAAVAATVTAAPAAAALGVGLALGFSLSSPACAQEDFDVVTNASEQAEWHSDSQNPSYQVHENYQTNCVHKSLYAPEPGSNAQKLHQMHQAVVGTSRTTDPIVTLIAVNDTDDDSFLQAGIENGRNIEKDKNFLFPFNQWLKSGNGPCSFTQNNKGEGEDRATGAASTEEKSANDTAAAPAEDAAEAEAEDQFDPDNMIEIVSIKDPRLYTFDNYNLRPRNYGQRHIGRVSFVNYKRAWARYLARNKTTDECRIFDNHSLFTIYGYGCVPKGSFERIEAQADDQGKLASVMIVQTIDGISKQDFRKMLKKRYKPINPLNTEVAHVSVLAEELCQAMSDASNQAYKCEIFWYRYEKSYMYLKFISFRGHDKVMMYFGSSNFMTGVAESLIKRRLAIVRQNLQHRNKRQPAAAAAAAAADQSQYSKVSGFAY